MLTLRHSIRQAQFPHLPVRIDHECGGAACHSQAKDMAIDGRGGVPSLDVSTPWLTVHIVNHLSGYGLIYQSAAT